MREYRSLIIVVVMTAGLTAAALAGNQIALQSAQGDVMVRNGVTETWTKVSAGDILNPDATVRTGSKSTAVIFLPADNKKISLPPQVMVDVSDIRQLTQEELMLKLTMEKVRASSYEWKNREMNIANTTVVHGEPRDKKGTLPETNPDVGVLELNGTREVLYDNGFYSTCALKAMEILRSYPSLNERFDNRLLVAQALEKAGLKSEALNEYSRLSSLEGISKEQQALCQSKISLLKRQ